MIIYNLFNILVFSHKIKLSELNMVICFNIILICYMNFKILMKIYILLIFLIFPMELFPNWHYKIKNCVTIKTMSLWLYNFLNNSNNPNSKFMSDLTIFSHISAFYASFLHDNPPSSPATSLHLLRVLKASIPNSTQISP